MSTRDARYSTDLVPRWTDVPADLAGQQTMAEALARADLLPKGLRGNPANVLLVLLGARALNVPAFWAWQSMHVIEGKLSLSAELMRALVQRAGHQIRVVKRTDKVATVRIQRSDRDEPYEASFTWDDAEKAKLSTRDNWAKYPKAMLVARATAIAVRDECPDVLFGVLYTPDELGAQVDADGNPVVDARGNPIIDGEVIEPAEHPAKAVQRVDRAAVMETLRLVANDRELTPDQVRNRLRAAFGKQAFRDLSDVELLEAVHVLRAAAPPDSGDGGAGDIQRQEAKADDAGR